MNNDKFASGWYTDYADNSRERYYDTEWTNLIRDKVSKNNIYDINLGKELVRFLTENIIKSPETTNGLFRAVHNNYQGIFVFTNYQFLFLSINNNKIIKYSIPFDVIESIDTNENNLESYFIIEDKNNSYKFEFISKNYISILESFIIDNNIMSQVTDDSTYEETLKQNSQNNNSDKNEKIENTTYDIKNITELDSDSINNEVVNDLNSAEVLYNPDDFVVSQLTDDEINSFNQNLLIANQIIRNDKKSFLNKKDDEKILKLSNELSLVINKLISFNKNNIFLKEQLDKMNFIDYVEMEKELQRIKFECKKYYQDSMNYAKEEINKKNTKIQELNNEINNLSQKSANLEKDIISLEEYSLLQEVGIYQYAHPAEHSEQYKQKLDEISQLIKQMNNKNGAGGAINIKTEWTVEGSKAKGRRMSADISKIVLQAFNGQADVIRKDMKPYKLDASKKKLIKIFDSLNTTANRVVNLEITQKYLQLRLTQFEITADWLQMKAEEKEEEKYQKQLLAEQRKALQEMETRKKEAQLHKRKTEEALDKLLANQDQISGQDNLQKIQELQEELEKYNKRIEDADYRIKNKNAGYVYLISNIGSFGNSIVKIGMTRRVEPEVRIRELSGASVPFKFDVHALFFSKDAFAIETELHHRFANKRVNLANRHKEFFFATPEEVRPHLIDLAKQQDKGSIINFNELALAEEYHQSQNMRKHDAS